MIFGYYGFPIKTIRPGEAHSTVESIQLIVRVFHIFYLPIFPYTKFWTVIKNGERFKIEGSSAMECERLYGNQGYPFYTFAGIILIGLLPIFFGMNGIIKSARQDQFTTEENIKKQEVLFEEIEELSLDNILIFGNEQGQFLCAKVLAIVNENLAIAMANSYSDSWKDEEEWITHYFMNEINFEKVNINKSDLLQTVQLNGFGTDSQIGNSFLRDNQLKLVAIKKLVLGEG